MCIPACNRRGGVCVYPRMHWEGGVYPSTHWAGGVCLGGWWCLPAGGGVCLEGVCIPACTRADTPCEQNDSNYAATTLWTVIINRPTSLKFDLQRLLYNLASLYFGVLITYSHRATVIN